MKKVSVSIIILTILMALSSCQKKSSEKEILSFKFVSPNVEASIEDKNIVAMVPSGTDVTNLVPVISVSDKATVNPASGMPQDFTQPVSYTVTAEDGSQAVYSAMVIKVKSSEKRILSFRFTALDLDATIDESIVNKNYNEFVDRTSKRAEWACRRHDASAVQTAVCNNMDSG